MRRTPLGLWLLAAIAGVLIACAGDDSLPDWCRASSSGVCLSDQAILPHETVEVIATEESWANEEVRACVLPDGWSDSYGEPCEEAVELGIATDDFQLNADEHGRVRFALEPMASDSDPRGTRPTGQFWVQVFGPGDTPLSIRGHGASLIVVDWE